jgi:hypothetical protein
MIVEALLLFIASIVGYDKRESPQPEAAKQIQTADININPNTQPCNGWGGGYDKN